MECKAFSKSPSAWGLTNPVLELRTHPGKNLPGCHTTRETPWANIEHIKDLHIISLVDSRSHVNSNGPVLKP